MDDALGARWTELEIPVDAGRRPTEAGVAVAVGAFLLGAIATRVGPALIALLTA